MPNERTKTEYEGVYFVQTEKEADKEFYIEYEKDGQLISKSVGLASAGMNAETAQSLREKLMKDEDVQDPKVIDQQAKVKEKMKSVRKILWDARGN